MALAVVFIRQNDNVACNMSHRVKRGFNHGRGSHGGEGGGVKCNLKTPELSARVEPVSEMAMIFGLSINV